MPASLSIDEPSGAVTVVSDQLTLLLLNENALLNTLDVSNCTKLVMLFLAPRCDRLTNVMLNPNLNAFSREEIEGIVAANRTRIAAEQARGNGCFGCAIQ